LKPARLVTLPPRDGSGPKFISPSITRDLPELVVADIVVENVRDGGREYIDQGVSSRSNSDLVMRAKV
jgi:hypothetical protein